MEREPVRQSQSDHGNATNGDNNRTAPISTTPAPTPPRLTPNPTLLDSAHPAQTPTASPPPPPLTPAPSLSAAPSHVPKAVAAAAAIAAGAPPPPPPHILVPAPPRLTSTGTPILRTYSRPILPSPMGGAPKTSSAATAMLALSSSSSLRLSARSPLASNNVSPSPSPAAASAPPPLPFSSTASSVSPSDAAATPPKSPAVLTNGNARPMSTHTSTAITPFHTPASPTGRQVTQALGTPGLVRANQIPTPVRQRVSQQALLLGKGLKGSGQDQALLRAQMLILTSAMRPSPSSSSSRPSSSSTPSSHPASAQLQSLTLRPPPPGTLAIPPSLRLKRPVSSSAPPPLCRGRMPLFPPLRPRPQPGVSVTESLAVPVRPHLSVPPPTLYSPVRAVPLRPRLHSPNGHSGAPPRQSAALQPITTSAPAHASQAPPINRHLVALKACPLSQANQSQQQHAAMSMVASQFERSPSAARQLQIIALSSGRQSQPGNSVHSAHSSVQSAPSTAVENPEPGSQLQRTLGSGDTPHLLQQPLNPSMPKTTLSSSSPLSSPPSLLCPSSPGGPPSIGSSAPPQTHSLLVRQGERQVGEEQRDKGRGGQAGPPRCGGGDEDIVGKDMRVNARDDQRGAEAREQEEERKGPASNIAETTATDPRRQRAQAVTDQEERMEVTEEGERERERRTVGGEREEEREAEERENPTDQAENLSLQNLHRHRNSQPSSHPEPNLHPPAPIQNSVPEARATMPPGLVATSSLPEPPASAQNQRLADAQREPISHEDLCENMSTQSDNQSALSSLSSQSPPSSPFITPSSDRTPSFLPPASSAQPAHPANLILGMLPLRQPDKITAQSQEEAENPDRSEEEDEESEHWAPRPWPEGRQVLTHLVEGFVIQEGLQPFPVNRSSLLVEPGRSATPPPPPQEVNGTNGTAALPETQRPERLEHSTDTDEGEGGAADSGQKDRVVLHCQFCGKRGHAHNFMRSKRFCSTSCARGFNVRLTKRLRALSAGSRPERPRPPLQRAESVPGKPLLLRLSRDSLQPRVLWTATRREAEEKGEEEEEEEEKDGEEADEEEEPAVVVTTKAERRSAARRTRRTASEPAMTTASAPTTPTTTYKSVPAHWSVEEVTAFIHTLPGCSEVAEAFRTQEIDGQALLLLTEDHLMTSMNIKLGPALKICAHINALRHQ